MENGCLLLLKQHTYRLAKSKRDDDDHHHDDSDGKRVMVGSPMLSELMIYMYSLLK